MAQQATNTIVLVRILMKHLTESLNPDDLVAFLDAQLRDARARGIVQPAEGEARLACLNCELRLVLLAHMMHNKRFHINTASSC